MVPRAATGGCGCPGLCCLRLDWRAFFPSRRWYKMPPDQWHHTFFQKTKIFGNDFDHFDISWQFWPMSRELRRQFGVLLLHSMQWRSLEFLPWFILELLWNCGSHVLASSMLKFRDTAARRRLFADLNLFLPLFARIYCNQPNSIIHAPQTDWIPGSMSIEPTCSKRFCVRRRALNISCRTERPAPQGVWIQLASFLLT